LSLNEAINIAFKNNPEIAKGKQKIDAANSKFTNGISLPQPNISLSYEFIPDGTGLKNYGEKTFEFNQSFEFPTRYFLKGSRLNKDIQIAESDFELTKLNLIGKIKSAYYKVVSKISGLKIAGENLQIADDFRVKSQIRYDVGEGTNLELLTAKVLKTEADNNIETAKYELKTAVSELQLAMGFSGNIEFEYNLTDSLFYKKYIFTLESLIESAAYNNPRLKIADLSINASSIEKSLAWQSLLPNLNFSYYRQSLGGNFDFYGFSFGISLPVWFMFDHNGKIQEANVNMKIAETEKKSLYNNIMTELKNDFLDFRNKERELLLYQSEILEQAEEVYRTAKVSYEQGEANYLLFLDAKKTIISAKNNYINSLYLYNLAFIELEQTTGKLFENSK
jgi:outer membrane protein TolC